MLIIPAIDLRKGQCVRLQQGQFTEVSIYPSSPQTLARHYAKQGACRLHLVDLDGAQSGEIQQLELIQSLKQPGVMLQVGGGIRTLETAQNCLKAGIDKLVLGSIAINDRLFVSKLIQSLDPQRIVLALDVNIDAGIPRPAIHGWQTTTPYDLWEVVNYYQDLGIREVLCTDIACDGMMSGPNFQLYQQATRFFPQIRWQASGGIRHEKDLKQLKTIGLSAAILGRMLYETDFDLTIYLEDCHVG
ncbi:1-(5-phosphoribosyl)-5-[(5-phosphoribosylamino)methylideneamino]imidazole-4-carboxamide isomerase [Legionella jordanis]|uniref:1-(5-phosphoribosyl)-5-[(5-phosphoribosylamino)methylideneamino] imidazole-4-carboxamide isomerase n=1 Tax=Legionella jordanis TaxID=456 RepID=A0A0W0VBE7_9GAMM|nr:1-(5-phosphoribosyl)-5-[(5-phosphoribosylamino)methylideneamino] imidazole-4-carboxamide isomerase [Legionella jordanis]KTD16969.1 phosphoribosylformimino-5-aminoimidazole carboxamide ribotide isomerase [Legionella jordanis]RMX03110.1 1-(5-phosphoribosyl)-5-[(5-phosphoribosylamino)methylideneamino] imidazole-4-carboxamide isomerase [Legionella jordanis]VEH12837.1 phosphoribosylformimino-5-aminoimidazole carboxamide ribotide isomerase [Legionella jordanis]